MFQLVLLLCCLLTFSCAKVFIKPKIIGGTDTVIDYHPYLASLQFTNGHVCGATILSPTMLLTSAYCVASFQVLYLSVRAGSTNTTAGGQVSRVRTVHRHPKYNLTNYAYDLSVVELETPLLLNSNVKPVVLSNKGEEPPVGTWCTVTGWGASEYDTVTENLLHKADVQKIDNSVCLDAYGSWPIPSMTQRMLCYHSSATGIGPCQGDEGGPLICNGHQVGLASLRIGCGYEGYPQVYTNISDPEIYDYIQSFLI